MEFMLVNSQLLPNFLNSPANDARFLDRMAPAASTTPSGAGKAVKPNGPLTKPQPTQKPPAGGKTFSDELISKSEKPSAFDSKKTTSTTLKPNQISDDEPLENVRLPSMAQKASPGENGAKNVSAASLRRDLANAIRSSSIIAFLTGHLEQVDPSAIPEIVGQSDFIQQALSSDVNDFLQTPITLKDLLSGFGIPKQLLNNAVINPDDLDQLITPSEFLKSIGVDPNRVLVELDLLQSNLQMDGLAPYVQRAIALQNQQGDGNRSKNVTATSNDQTNASSGSENLDDKGRKRNNVNGAAIAGGAVVAGAASPLNNAEQQNLVSDQKISNKEIGRDPLTNKPIDPKAKPQSPGTGAATPQSAKEKITGKQGLVETTGISAPKANDVPSIEPKPTFGLDKSFEKFPTTPGNVSPNLNANNISGSTAFTASAAAPTQDLSANDDLWSVSRIEKVTTDPFADISKNVQFDKVVNFDSSVLDDGAIRYTKTNPLSEVVMTPEDVILRRFELESANISVPASIAYAEKVVPFKENGILANNKADFDSETDFSDMSDISSSDEQPISSKIATTLKSDLQSYQLSHSSKPLWSTERMLELSKDILKDTQNLNEKEISEEFTTDSFDFGASLTTSNTVNSDAKISDFNVAAVKENVAKHVADKASMLVKNGGGSIRVDIGTPETGKIDLAISVVNDQVHMRIVTASDKAREILGQDLDKLRTSLSDQNLRLVKVEVGTDSGGRHNSSNNQAQNFFNDFSHNQQWQGNHSQAFNDSYQQLRDSWSHIKDLGSNRFQFNTPASRVLAGQMAAGFSAQNGRIAVLA